MGGGGGGVNNTLLYKEGLLEREFVAAFAVVLLRYAGFSLTLIEQC